MTNDNSDIQSLELELEDLYARLRRIKRENKQTNDTARVYTQELLYISQSIREVATRIRLYSEQTRTRYLAAAIEHAPDTERGWDKQAVG